MTPPPEQYRQGDILLVAVDTLPAEAEPLPFPSGLLALMPPVDPDTQGTHQLAASVGLRAYRRSAGDGAIEWLEIAGGSVSLTHPEHAPMTLTPGLWHVIRQREFDPAASAPRRARD